MPGGAVQDRTLQSPGLYLFAHSGPRFKEQRHWSNERCPTYDPAMGIRIKIRPRAPLPNPWKWEIFDDDQSKLITASHLSYGSREEAYSAGEQVLAEMMSKGKPAG
jgi:hypothetical protein